MMMSGEIQLKADERLKAHLDNIEDYIQLSNIKFSQFYEDYVYFASLDRESLSKLTTQELFDASYMLYGYATYIQDEINKNKVIVDWCDNEIQRMLITHQFDQYTKHETKIQIVVRDNSYATKVHQMQMIASARLQSLEGKVWEIKRQADILLERGKRL